MGLQPYMCEVKFDGNLPDSKEILNNLKNNTGLDLELEYPKPEFYPSVYLIKSLKLKEEICFMPDNDILTVIIPISEKNYIEGAIYYTLSQMGGRHNYEIPEWTKQKYGDIDAYTKRLYRMTKLKESLKTSRIWTFFLALSYIVIFPFYLIKYIFFLLPKYFIQKVFKSSDFIKKKVA